MHTLIGFMYCNFSHMGIETDITDINTFECLPMYIHSEVIKFAGRFQFLHSPMLIC
jgi:hypothetical protein